MDDSRSTASMDADTLAASTPDHNASHAPKPIEDVEKQQVSKDRPSTVTAQDWSGPDDPENPWNWPTWKRIYITSVTAIIGFTVTLGSSVYTPGIPDIMKEMEISRTVALLGLSMWVLGLAFGPVLAAPISETFGRSAVYLTSLPLSMLFTMGAGLSRTPAQLIVTRFFGGFFGGPVLAVGAGTNADLWPPAQRAVATSLFVLAPFAGPALGPCIGGYATQSYNWRWTQWMTLVVGGFSLLYSLPVSETHKKTILQRRAKRLQIPGPSGPAGKAAIKLLITVTVIRPLHMLATEPIVIFFSLYVAFNFSVLFGFFDAFPLVFSGVYGFDLGEAGLVWLAVLVGCLLGVATVIAIDRMVYRPRYFASIKEGKGGIVAPEHRLYAAMLGSFGLPVGLFWFGWTGRTPHISWVSPMMAAVPFAWGNITVFCSCALYLIDTYGPMSGASAMAANGLLRYTLGAAFPLFTNEMYEKLGIGWASSLYGFIAVALLPIPWVLFWSGPKIRAKSRYDTIKI